MFVGLVKFSCWCFTVVVLVCCFAISAGLYWCLHSLSGLFASDCVFLTDAD